MYAATFFNPFILYIVLYIFALAGEREREREFLGCPVAPVFSFFRVFGGGGGAPHFTPRLLGHVKGREKV